MSRAAERATLYLELERLSKQALASLHGGLDLAVLGPIFERKAALNALISENSIEGLESDREGLTALLDAQSRAVRSEADLVETLQKNIPHSGIKLQGATKVTPSKWDLQG